MWHSARRAAAFDDVALRGVLGRRICGGPGRGRGLRCGASVAGSAKGVDDDGPRSKWKVAGPTIFSVIGDWRAVEESMPSNCLRTSSGRTRWAQACRVLHRPAELRGARRAADG